MACLDVSVCPLTCIIAFGRVCAGFSGTNFSNIFYHEGIHTCIYFRQLTFVVSWTDQGGCAPYPHPAFYNVLEHKGFSSTADLSTFFSCFYVMFCIKYSVHFSQPSNKTLLRLRIIMAEMAVV